MSAALLRRAAEKLRESASNATVGPWDVADDGLVWAPRLGDPVSGSTDLEDAEHIALMHPPVALTLADLFELQANFTDATPDAIVGEPLAAVARAILREDPT